MLCLFPFRRVIPSINSSSIMTPEDPRKVQSRCVPATTLASSGHHRFAICLSLLAVLVPPLPAPPPSHVLPVDTLSTTEAERGTAWHWYLLFLPLFFDLFLKVSEAIPQNPETSFLPEAKLKSASLTVGSAGKPWAGWGSG